MEVYINKAGELTCQAPDPQATVANLIDAIVGFCQIHMSQGTVIVKVNFHLFACVKLCHGCSLTHNVPSSLYHILPIIAKSDK